MFDKLEELSQSRGLLSSDSVLGGGISPLERCPSEATIPNASEDPDGDQGLYSVYDSDSPGSLHQVVQQLVRALMTSAKPAKGTLLPSGSSPGTPIPNWNDWNALFEAAARKDFALAPSPELNEHDPSSPFRTPSPSERRPSKPTHSKASFSIPSFNGTGLNFSIPPTSSVEMQRSGSDNLTHLSRAQTCSSDYAVTEASSETAEIVVVPSRPFDETPEVSKDTRKGKELLDAIKTRSMDTIESLLRQSAGVEESDERGRTPLILAASMGLDNVVRRLILNGASTCAEDHDRATALHHAVKNNFSSITVLLLRHRDGPLQANMRDKKGRTPLHYRTYYPTSEDTMLQDAKSLIARGADINMRDGGGNSKEEYRFPPIYYAIKNRKYAVVELLLVKDVDLKFKRPDTSPEIHQLLEDFLNQSTGISATTINQRKSSQSRKDSIKSEKEPKTRRLSSFGRKRNGTKT